MYLSNEQIEIIIIRTIFGAMGPIKEPIYLSKIISHDYLNLMRKYIVSIKDNNKINNHDLYIILEWLYEIK